MLVQRIGGKVRLTSHGVMEHLIQSGVVRKLVKDVAIATHLNFPKNWASVRRVQISGEKPNQPRQVRDTMSKWGVGFSALIIGTNCLSGTRWRVIRIQS